MSTMEIFGDLLKLLGHPNVLPVLGGLVAMVFAIIVLAKMKKKGLLPNRLERRMAKAVALGHTAEGHRVRRSRYNRNEPGETREMSYRTTYEFFAEGEKWETTVITRRRFPPETTTIYYLHSPRKAFTAYQPHSAGLLPLFLVVICLMVFYITALLLGARP